MTDLSLEKFDPSKEQMLTLVKKSKSIDTTKLSAVHDMRIELRDTRILINKKGKELREDAIIFQKAVISKEKELIALLEPEELRLESVEEDFKKKERMAKLPERRAAIEATGYTPDAEVFDPELFDSELCGMTDLEFERFRLGCVEKKLHKDAQEAAEKNEREEREARAKQEAEQARVAEEQRKKQEAIDAQNRIEREKIEKERREHQAKIDAENRKIEAEKEKIRIEAEAKQRAEAAAKAEAERKEAEAKAEKARLELEAQQQQEREEFKALMKKHGVTKELIELKTFIIVGGRLYKVCG